eukprot:1150490-Pelagomonas_calceolata.AAC.1
MVLPLQRRVLDMLYDGSEASLSAPASMTTLDHRFWSSRGKSDSQAPQLYLPARAAKQKGACHQMKSTYRLFAFHAMMDTTDVATLQRLMEVSAGDVLAQ